MSNSSVAPFVKWAGGKRQLLPQIKERMPEKYNNYYEPFVGGGAVTFELLPANALINDINKALINAYKQICNEPTDLMFYIAIQEDINYPGVRYQGRKMCFYRYFEAIYCKVHANHRIEEAIEKAVARGYIPVNWHDVGDLYDVVSRIQR